MRRLLGPIFPALLFFALALEFGSLFSYSTAFSQTRSIPAPQDVLGFTPGDDRKLASWAKVVEYFQKLATSSDRVKFEEIGKSTMGAPFVYATISAPENLKRLNEYKAIQRQLADPPILADGLDNADTRSRGQAENASWARQNWPRAERKATDLVKAGKTVIVITCGIHSTEVGSYLSSMLIAYRLASSNEPEVQEILKNTIILLVPSTNPDGVDIVNNWYQKTLGTPYEGTEPPELYHKYTGHDDNRDWYAFTQVETQLTVDKIHNVWHPQITHDIHQQGEYGSRLFLPPYMQPVEPNVPRALVQGYTELGNWMAAEMRAKGFEGITTNSTYDAWSPARAYSHYHGGVRMLSETASARIATPITLKFEELRSREGYDPQKESPKFGPLWRGGEWHLSDITKYMTTAAFLLLDHAATNREQWLRRFYAVGKEAVRPRRPGELYGFLIESSNEATSSLITILQRGGVEVTVPKAGPKIGDSEFPDTTRLVRMDQPYGAFAKALLEVQRYPNLRDETEHPIAPYDVTAHTLPLLMGVTVRPVKAPFRYSPERFQLTEQVVQVGGGSQQSLPALYHSSVPSQDEGRSE